MAELAGPRAVSTAVGRGPAISSAGVTRCPLLLGLLVERAGGFTRDVGDLAPSMRPALLLLLAVREGPAARS